jgi:hypothetical protein
LIGNDVLALKPVGFHHIQNTTHGIAEANRAGGCPGYFHHVGHQFNVAANESSAPSEVIGTDLPALAVSHATQKFADVQLRVGFTALLGNHRFDVCSVHSIRGLLREAYSISLECTGNNLCFAAVEATGPCASMRFAFS